ncbi:Uncharacterised protein family Ycf36 [Ostreococcus tauri]|uniref:DUF1230-domain-containing protein n=1 Tax=Ostreococcus tauri TaxID=70448 RepID=A0A096P953_OSTTA|nr:Uncharacterised protein family Ycf36 [Ostreococcus tauri]CEG00744.1 Uncharacterised protein family Ycf36 [Ostreococcus tauri]|eukprot:XP_003084171.2 Uncharacterised protein family Ycf36 [Ostreococcus tauri]
MVTSMTPRSCPSVPARASVRGRVSARTTRARRRDILIPRVGGSDEYERSGSLLDAMEDACPVPRDQRPASQLAELKDGFVMSWPTNGALGYAVRMGALFTFFYGVVAYPIACGSYDPEREFTQTVVSALVGASGATAAMALNMYNGWAYVRDRLLSATVEYEETGWYDGQVYVKDPEMLARDRLLGTYTARPVVELLRKTLLACGTTAMVSLIGLKSIDAPEGGRYGDYGTNMGYYSESSAAKFEEADDDEDMIMMAEMSHWSAPAIETE